jgi:hypothetical protein
MVLAFTDQWKMGPPLTQLGPPLTQGPPLLV